VILNDGQTQFIVSFVKTVSTLQQERAQ
jgi:hypothetical protein